MSTTARILKADLEPRARRLQLAELSRADHFEPLCLPHSSPARAEPIADARLDTALTALRSAAEQLQRQRDHWLEQSQHEAVRLGVAIAERLLRRTLAVEPEAIIERIRSALEWSAPTESPRVRLHSADAKLVAALPTDRSFASVEFIEDESLARGDCLVETAHGQTDARWHVILQRITDELLDESEHAILQTEKCNRTH